MDAHRAMLQYLCLDLRHLEPSVVKRVFLILVEVTHPAVLIAHEARPLFLRKLDYVIARLHHRQVDSHGEVHILA